mgnify:CR=1 FL=1
MNFLFAKANHHLFGVPLALYAQLSSLPLVSFRGLFHEVSSIPDVCITMMQCNLLLVNAVCCAVPCTIGKHGRLRVVVFKLSDLSPLPLYPWNSGQRTMTSTQRLPVVVYCLVICTVLSLSALIACYNLRWPSTNTFHSSILSLCWIFWIINPRLDINHFNHIWFIWICMSFIWL